MKILLRTALSVLISLSILSACTKTQAQPETSDENITTMTQQTPDTASAKVEIKTTAGDFTVLLYGDTPKHRDNFLRLVREGYYDSTLFHRVIKNFMVQAGDPDSKTAPKGAHLGAGGPDYKIDAEIVYPAHFHKRGALAAARQGDQVNPMRQSSGSQFYVVTGNKVSEGQLAQLENQLKNRQMQTVFNELAMEHRPEIIEMQRTGDRDGLRKLQDELIAQTEAKVAAMPAPALTPEQREAYTTVGGAPHLDGDYTVFGEVIKGMDVIDRIEKAETDGADRPKDDIRILSMKVIE
ncbi:MAG: peptidylprolyl isomerase [Bacteroidales bacterium]|nr:peptidylprolyl isomerase [Bacteroidales bacterium]